MVSEIYNNVPVFILYEFIKIKIEKETLVKKQQYEEASKLRDRERDISNLYDLSNFMMHLKENNLSLENALRDIKIQEILN